MKSRRTLLLPARRKIPNWKFWLSRTIGVSAALFDMKEGEHVELINVAGDGFDRKSSADAILVFTAMGTGVAPLRSALRQRAEPQR